MKKKQTYYLEEDTVKSIIKLSKETRVPASQYVQEALEDLLKKYNVDVIGTTKEKNYE